MGGVGREEVVKEVKRQLWLGGPLFSLGLLQYSVQIISVMFVGHVGEVALSGASLATSFASLTGFNLLMGMASALDTLCGQSYGAAQYHMLGIHTQRSMFVLLIVSAFLAAIWANTKPILIAMQQDSAIAEEAGTYARTMIPSLFAYGLLQCLVRFLQAQNNVFPMVLTSGITAIVHILLCWVLVFKVGFGSRGAAIANSISYWVNVTLMGLYIKFSSSCRKTWTGFSKSALHHICDFIEIAIPSALMLCLKVWTFEVIVLLSGLLPNPKLETAVLSICLNIFGLVWMIPFGLSAAVSVRVSNELGAGIRVISLGLLMIMLRNYWGYVYSNEEEVIRNVANMMPVLAISIFLDGIQSVLSGVARGCGWQKIGAYVNLGSFYLVGVPSSVVLAFVCHMNSKGLWCGLVFAFTIQVVCFTIITIRTNWEKQANEAASRVQSCTILTDTAARDQIFVA